MLQSFIRAAGLRRWLSRSECPLAIQECKRLFEKAFTPRREYVSEEYMSDYRDDSLLDDDDHTSTAKDVPVPDDMKAIVKARRITLRARLPHNRVMYASSSTHVGNSLVYFYPNGDTTLSPVPGSIKYIYGLHGRLEFAVQRQLPIHNSSLDPFRHYPHFPARLYSSSLSAQLEIVHVDWVMCHFARYRITSSHAVVLSLSKVSLNS
jgi:hypothetical protein